MKDYIFIYCENYKTNLVTSKFHFINYLLKKNSRVMYVETPFSIFSIFFNFKSFLYNFKEIFGYKKNGNLFIVSNLNIFPFHRFLRINLFNKLNQFHNVLKINNLINKMNFRDIDLIIYSPLLNDYVSKIKNIKNKIFIINDDYSAFDERYSSFLIKNYCNYIFNNSNYIFYNSSYCLNKLISKKNLMEKVNLFKINHGVPNKINYPLNNLKKINDLFYYGQINKIDINIIIKLANNFNNLTFHVIGNLNQVKYKKLSNINNLKFYNSMPRDSLMKLITKFDIALFPFKSSKLTDSMLPIKIFEILNLNKPVITTNLPTIREVFNNHVYYVSNLNLKDDFEKILQDLKNKKYIDNSRKFLIEEWNDIFNFIIKKINGHNKKN